MCSNCVRLDLPASCFQTCNACLERVRYPVADVWIGVFGEYGIARIVITAGIPVADVWISSACIKKHPCHASNFARVPITHIGRCVTTLSIAVMLVVAGVPIAYIGRCEVLFLVGSAKNLPIFLTFLVSSCLHRDWRQCCSRICMTCWSRCWCPRCSSSWLRVAIKVFLP